MLITLVPGLMRDVRVPCPLSTNVFTVPQKSVSSSARMTSACPTSAPPRRLIEVMVGRHVHASALIDDRRVQGLSQLDQTPRMPGRARHTVGDDHRPLRHGQKARGLAHRIGVAVRRCGRE